MKTGIINNVIKVLDIIPPTITHPIACLASAPAPTDNAKGSAPKTVAKVVIRIGRRSEHASQSARKF